MPLYSQRKFIRAVPVRKNGTTIQVLCFIWHNDTADRWEIDYCDKVTKDTMKVDLPPAIPVGAAGRIDAARV